MLSRKAHLVSRKHIHSSATAPAHSIKIKSPSTVPNVVNTNTAKAAEHGIIHFDLLTFKGFA